MGNGSEEVGTKLLDLYSGGFDFGQINFRRRRCQTCLPINLFWIAGCQFLLLISLGDLGPRCPVSF